MMNCTLRSGLRALLAQRTFTSAAPTRRAPEQASRVASALENEIPVKERSAMSTTSMLFFGMPVALTFSLGVWQVYRLKRKERLIEEREQQLAAPPFQVSQLFDSNAADCEYRRVQVSGRFLHGKEMLVGPRSAPKELPPPVLQWGGSSGLQVITPFELDSGEIILVNRGWIPQRLASASKRASAVVSPLPFLEKVSADTPLQNYEDEADRYVSTSFTAVVRGCDERNRFTPDNKPESNEWYYIDADSMLQSSGLARDDHQAVLVELLEPLPKCGWPHPRSVDDMKTFRTPPSTHITYAVTWFSLSFALGILTRHRIKQHKMRN